MCMFFQKSIQKNAKKFESKMLKKKTNKHKHAKKPPTDLLVKFFPARVLTRPLSLITHIVAHKRAGTPPKICHHQSLLLLCIVTSFFQCLVNRLIY